MPYGCCAGKSVFVNTVRFVGQFTTGYGNYTEEREQLFAEMTLDDIVAQMKQDKVAESSATKKAD